MFTFNCTLRSVLIVNLGYDTGIISAVLVYLNDDLGKVLNASEKELITSITSGGAFIGAIAAGLTADRFGRKGAIYSMHFSSVLCFPMQT